MAQRRKVKDAESVIADEDLVEEIEYEQVEDEEELLPLGTDSSALFAVKTEQTLEIIHEGKRYLFKYKDLTWGEKNACVDAAQSWDQIAGFSFSVSKYYAVALTRMLTDTPIRPISGCVYKSLLSTSSAIASKYHLPEVTAKVPALNIVFPPLFIYSCRFPSFIWSPVPHIVVLIGSRVQKLLVGESRDCAGVSTEVPDTVA